MILRQLFDAETGTYTYLLADADTLEAVMIDPVRGQIGRDVELVEQLGCRVLWVLETHVHADHVTGGGELRRRLGCRLAVGKRAGVLTADAQLVHGDLIRFGRHRLEVRETPGHTDGCVTYVCHDEGMAFTGDALLIRGCGRTDFQQGDARTLYGSVRERILGLPPATLLYPAHDYRGRTVTTVDEERRFNPRLGAGKTLEEFVAIMQALRLSYPQRMDEAVPANMASGVTDPETTDTLTPEPAEWAELFRTASGVPVVTAAWLATHRSQTRVIDVREDVEFGGPLGHIEGSELVPLATVIAHAREWRRETPIVAVCTYGTRSGKAAALLRERGFARVASLHGGLIGWRAAGYPAVGGLAAMSDRQDAAGWEGMDI